MDTLLEDKKAFEVGEIGNYYGCLEVKVEKGVPYWSIENWDGHHWEQITPKLYLALVEFSTTLKEV